jgi:hypothetical protein
MSVPAGFLPMRQHGAVALQLWDAARGARLRDRIEVVVEREYPRRPEWAAEQALRRNRHLYGLSYGRGAKTAIDFWLYDSAWRYVPRRLHVPVPAAPEPDTGAQPRLRIRRAALYPGPAYDVMSGTTGLRGRLEHVVSGAAVGVRWPRVVAADPAGTLTPLAVAHGDDKGEFLLVLPPSRLLAPTAPRGEVRVGIEIAWQALPPYAAGSDPLADLPLETVGAAVGVAEPDMVPLAERPDPMAMGWQLPSSYGTTIHRTVTFTAGRIHRDVFVV